MHVLVTGGAGYIGSHTLKALSSAGYSPVTYDNLTSGHRWAVKWGSLVQGDLSNYELICDTIRRYRITAVLHFAAFAYVAESIVHPEKYFQNNVGDVVTLLRAARATGVRHVVFSSTCATYGTPSRLPITERSPQRPINPYGESKLMVERMLRWYREAYGIHSVCLRYFNAAGADPDGEIGECHVPETHLVPSIIEAALKQRPHIDVYGTDYETPDGTAVRDFVHVSDLARAHVQALEYLRARNCSNAFNLGTGRGFSIREAIESVERVSRRSVKVRYGPRRVGDAPALVASAAKAHRLLDWRPRFTSLDEIVATAWAWHSRNEKDAMAAVS
jgi:UDP-arabinose 4-epimerase